MVINEFINRFARVEYEQLATDMKPASFKEYRQSEKFKAVAQEISISTKKIIKWTFPEKMDTVIKLHEEPLHIEQGSYTLMPNAF